MTDYFLDQTHGTIVADGTNSKLAVQFQDLSSGQRTVPVSSDLADNVEKLEAGTPVTVMVSRFDRGVAKIFPTR